MGSVTTTMTIEDTNVHTFESRYLPKFKDGIAKLAKRAEKLGVEPVTFEIEGYDVRQEMTYIEVFGSSHPDEPPYMRQVPSGITAEVEYVTVRTHGESPVLPGGWRFVGAIEHLVAMGASEAGNMVHGDDPVLAQYRDSDPNCDHCGLDRKRNKTVILRSEAGEVVQVGASCMKDFLGYHATPDSIVAWLDYVPEMVGEFEEGGWNYFNEVPTSLFMTAVAATVRTHGWASRSGDSSAPTADIVSALLTGPKGKDIVAEKAREVRMLDEDEVEAKAVIEWAKAIDPNTSSDYLHNVRVALSGNIVLARHFGIAASAVSAKAKEESKAKAREVAEGKRAASEFVGTVGERRTFEVEVVFVRAIESEYGWKYLVIMEDADGNSIKTFNSGQFGMQAEKGDRYVLKATIKDHEVYNGTKSTMITRAKIEQKVEG